MSPRDDAMKFRVPWLCAVVCRSTWPDAARLVIVRTRKLHPTFELNLLRDDSLRRRQPGKYPSRVAAALAADAVMSCAWKLLALHPDDGPLKRSETICGAAGLLELVPDAAADALRRLEIWKTTEFPRGEFDFFKVAEAALAKQRDGSAATVFDFPLPDEEPEPEVPTGPSVVVICGDRVVEKGLPHAWKDLLDEKLPLVVCRDAVVVRERLVLEYPHAVREVAMLTQDLRSGEPVRIKPTILLGPPGGGKSRLVRRFAEIVSPALYVSRFRRGELVRWNVFGNTEGLVDRSGVRACASHHDVQDREPNLHDGRNRQGRRKHAQRQSMVGHHASP